MRHYKTIKFDVVTLHTIFFLSFFLMQIISQERPAETLCAHIYVNIQVNFKLQIYTRVFCCKFQKSSFFDQFARHFSPEFVHFKAKLCVRVSSNFHILKEEKFSSQKNIYCKIGIFFFNFQGYIKRLYIVLNSREK